MIEFHQDLPPALPPAPASPLDEPTCIVTNITPADVLLGLACDPLGSAAAASLVENVAALLRAIEAELEQQLTKLAAAGVLDLVDVRGQLLVPEHLQEWLEGVLYAGVLVAGRNAQRLEGQPSDPTGQARAWARATAARECAHRLAAARGRAHVREAARHGNAGGGA